MILMYEKMSKLFYITSRTCNICLHETLNLVFSKETILKLWLFTYQTVLIRMSLVSTMAPAPAKSVSTSTIFFMQLPQVAGKKSMK